MRIFSSQTYIWKCIHTKVLYLINSLLGPCCEKKKRNNGHLSLWLCLVIMRSVICKKVYSREVSGHEAWLTQVTREPITDMACKKRTSNSKDDKTWELPENEIGEREVTAQLLCFPYPFSIQIRWVQDIASSMTKLGDGLSSKCKGPIVKSNLFHYAGNKWLNN